MPRPAAIRRPSSSWREALTAAGGSYKEAGSRDPVDRAQVAELVDALASGASGLTAVKVRVLSWAPSSSRLALSKAPFFRKATPPFGAALPPASKDRLYPRARHPYIGDGVRQPERA